MQRKHLKYLSMALLIVFFIVFALTYSKLNSVWVQKEFALSLKELRSETPTGAVILASPQNKETIEYYSKRTAYLQDNEADMKKLAALFLSDKLPKITGNNLYIFVTVSDLRMVEELNKYAKIDGIRNPVVTDYNLIFEINEEGLGKNFYDNETNATIIIQENEEGNVKSARIVYKDNTEAHAKYLISEGELKVFDPNGKGCLYQDQQLMYFDEKLCNTMLVKMMTGQNITGLELVHDEPFMRVYRVI
jgi:hypothetical protein